MGNPSKEFPLRQLVESGKFTNVKAIPTNEYITMSTGDGIQFGAKTKLRIPVEQVQDFLGTGLMGGSTENNVERLFGGREVVEKIDKETSIPYYEIDAVMALPKSDSEVWQTLNQLYQNSKGIGGSSQAKEAYDSSSKEVADY